MAGPEATRRARLPVAASGAAPFGRHAAASGSNTSRPSTVEHRARPGLDIGHCCLIYYLRHRRPTYGGQRCTARRATATRLRRPRGCDQPQKRRAAPRAPRRAADGHPRHHGREHRAAEPRQGPAAQRLTDQLDDHELLARLRQPPALRRPRRRPARAPAPVPDRPRRLHRCRRSPRPSPAPPPPCSRHVRARVSAPRCSPRPRSRSSRPASTAREGEGARRLGRGRRRRCSDRRPRRRPPHRVRRLADDLLRQPPRRSRTRDRRAQGHPGRHREAALARARPARRGRSQRRASAQSSTRSRRARVPAGLPPRRSPFGSRRPRGPRRVRRPRAPHREAAPAGSSGSPIAPSAAASS